MILITTSHRPTQKMRTLIKDLNRVLPNTIRTNRGKLSMKGVAEKALEYRADRVIIVERYKGSPGGILLYKITSDRLEQIPPQIYLNEVKTQDELGERKSVKGNLTITTPSNPSIEAKKLAAGLSDFLRIPYLEQENQLNSQATMQITPTPRYEAKISFTMPPTVKDVGPILIVKHVSYQGSDNERKNLNKG